jgi:cation transport regulator ChaC
MKKLKYFAYGSNMSSKRMKARVPFAGVIGVGVLRGHRLVFHKVSHDGSGKCDVIESESDDVMGVLYEINEIEKLALDSVEGLNHGYKEKAINVELKSGEVVSAVTYFATNINPGLRPYTWYMRHVLEGAREANLPSEYTSVIEAISAIEDSDKLREANELAIYGQQRRIDRHSI